MKKKNFQIQMLHRLHGRGFMLHFYANENKSSNSLPETLRESLRAGGRTCLREVNRPQAQRPPAPNSGETAVWKL
jgi:hypothetical protein